MTKKTRRKWEAEVSKKKALVREYDQIIYGKLVVGKLGELEQVHGLYKPHLDTVVKIRSAKHKRQLRLTEGQDDYPGLKVVFVEGLTSPLGTGELIAPKLTYHKDGSVEKTFHHVSLRTYPFLRPFEPVDIAKGIPVDVEAHVKRECARILKLAPDVKSWAVKLDQRMTSVTKSRSGIAAYVLYLLQKYKGIGEAITGLVAITYTDQGALSEFKELRQQMRSQVKKLPPEKPKKRGQNRGKKRGSK